MASVRPKIRDQFSVQHTWRKCGRRGDVADAQVNTSTVEAASEQTVWKQWKVGGF